jgi:hypothetical protein
MAYDFSFLLVLFKLQHFFQFWTRPKAKEIAAKPRRTIQFFGILYNSKQDPVKNHLSQDLGEIVKNLLPERFPFVLPGTLGSLVATKHWPYQRFPRTLLVELCQVVGPSRQYCGQRKIHNEAATLHFDEIHNLVQFCCRLGHLVLLHKGKCCDRRHYVYSSHLLEVTMHDWPFLTAEPASSLGPTHQI